MRTPQMTIAQQRRKEVLKLAAMHEENPSDETIREAERLMNSYYRLAGLDYRLLDISNDTRTCNLWYTQKLEDKAYRWWRRLSKEFTDFCGLRLQYFGALPSIVDKDNYRKIHTFWYN